MSFANMELRIAIPVGGKIINYPYCISEEEFERQQNYEANPYSH